MKVNVSKEVLETAKILLEDRGRAALRFDITGFSWAGPVFSIVLDEQRETDVVHEVDGVKFVIEDTFADLVKDVEVITHRGGFTIKQDRSC